MKNRQKASNQHLKKYKNKYVSVKDIYNKIKKGVRVKSTRGTRMLDYSEYYCILEAFLDEAINVIVNEQEVFKMPNKMGNLYLKRLPHTRPFHVRIDHEESEKKGELVFYKVPILDDCYTKVMWDRPYKYSRYKVLPLKRFKELIKR